VNCYCHHQENRSFPFQNFQQQTARNRTTANPEPEVR